MGLPFTAFRMAPSLASALEGAPVRVGTQNPSKLDAAEGALRRFARDEASLLVLAVDVPSGVAEQPIGWSEIVGGARNRARAAFESGDCALAIGIEDGLVRLEDVSSEVGDIRPLAFEPRVFYNVGCAWLTDGEREGHGFSSGFAYPPGCLEPAVRGQEPIGELFDALWRSHRGVERESAKSGPSGRQGGNIGMLTQGRLERSAYGTQAVVCALVRFLHIDLYD